MSVLTTLLSSYTGKAEIVGHWGSVRIVKFTDEPVRGWGFDVWVDDERVHASINTEWSARWLAANYCSEARPVLQGAVIEEAS